MTKLGTSKRPLILRVRSLERAQHIAAMLEKLDIQFVLGVEPNQPEDVSDLERYLQRPKRSSFWSLR